jgi:hypothetical protein
MATVGVSKAIKYGFVLLGYFVAVFLIGGFIAFIGSLIATAGGDAGGIGGILLVLVGGIMSIIGLLMIYAGFLGTGYKVIADGVKRGIENSDGFDTEGKEQDRNALERKDRDSSERRERSSSQ